MNHTRAAAILDSQTTMARKVYDATPISEPWTYQSITSECVRLGYSYSAHDVRGALRSLAESGLVKDLSGGLYQRVKVKEAHVAHVPQETAKPNLQAVPDKPASSLDELASIAKSLRAQAATLNARADELDNLALDLMAEKDHESEAQRKLRTLQDALRGLSA